MLLLELGGFSLRVKRGNDLKNTPYPFQEMGLKRSSQNPIFKKLK
ncbi:hypothetical protein HMPREF1432_00930 [Helicobacter pylori GAMchJs114i]|nr:hypothetical protein HMPREF1432_00930 [Helicobacter pylori GAMchJs114i]